MSARSQRKYPKLDLKLNLSPSRTHRRDDEEDQDQVQDQEDVEDSLSTPSSGDTSCLSSTAEDNTGVCDNPYGYGSQTQVTVDTKLSSMVLLGCPRCLMYVMLSEVEPRCPRCKTTGLLDLIGGDLNANNNKKKT